MAVNGDSSLRAGGGLKLLEVSSSNKQNPVATQWEEPERIWHHAKQVQGGLKLLEVSSGNKIKSVAPPRVGGTASVGETRTDLAPCILEFRIANCSWHA